MGKNEIMDAIIRVQLSIRISGSHSQASLNTWPRHFPVFTHGVFGFFYPLRTIEKVDGEGDLAYIEQASKRESRESWESGRAEERG